MSTYSVFDCHHYYLPTLVPTFASFIASARRVDSVVSFYSDGRERVPLRRLQVQGPSRTGRQDRGGGTPATAADPHPLERHLCIAELKHSL